MISRDKYSRQPTNQNILIIQAVFGGVWCGVRLGVCAKISSNQDKILYKSNLIKLIDQRQHIHIFGISGNCTHFTNWTWREEPKKPSCKFLSQEWWSYFVKVLQEYLDVHWESWSCASRSFCGYVSSSWGRMSLKLLSMIILKVRPASFRYVTKSFWSKLNFSNISYHFV